MIKKQFCMVQDLSYMCTTWPNLTVHIILFYGKESKNGVVFTLQMNFLEEMIWKLNR